MASLASLVWKETQAAMAFQDRRVIQAGEALGAGRVNGDLWAHPERQVRMVCKDLEVRQVYQDCWVQRATQVQQAYLALTAYQAAMDPLELQVSQANGAWTGPRGCRVWTVWRA